MTVLRVRTSATTPTASANRTTAAVMKMNRRENLRPNTRCSVSGASTIHRKADTTTSVMPGPEPVLRRADWKRNFRAGDAEMFLNPNIRIGCSGWQYRHWRGDFYPAELPQHEWLNYYAERFDTVEINNTFYRLPEAATFASWGRRAPRGFVYAVKASRFLTHMKKLKDPEEPIARFFTRAKRLEHAFGPVLYQLPPRWPVNLERLETFLEALPRTRRHTIEFREPSWYCDEVFALLERHKVSLCLHDMAGSA